MSATVSRDGPSAMFELPAGHTAYASTPDTADQDQLFSGVGGIGTISLAAPGAPRNPATDVKVTLPAANRWVPVPVAPGSWQVYTVDLGQGLRVVIDSCPA